MCWLTPKYTMPHSNKYLAYFFHSQTWCSIIFNNSVHSNYYIYWKERETERAKKRHTGNHFKQYERLVRPIVYLLAGWFVCGFYWILRLSNVLARWTARTANNQKGHWVYLCTYRASAISAHHHHGCCRH